VDDVIGATPAIAMTVNRNRNPNHCRHRTGDDYDSDNNSGLPVREITPACSIRRSPPLNYRENEQALSHLTFADSWGGSRLHELHNVYVSPYGALFLDGAVLPYSIDYSLADRKNRATFLKKIALGRARRVSGTCVVAHNAFFKNYYHWLLEALPRIYAARREVRGTRYLVCADTRDFHRQSLALFGFSDVLRVGRDSLVLAERLLFPSPVNEGYAQHNPELLRGMAAWLRARTSVTAPERPARRRLYVGRGGNTRRRIVNEDELVLMLGKHGFEHVRLEEQDFACQVRLFSEARCVVAIHGAGLSNMIFMKQGAAVMELISERYRDTSFFNLAGACGHRIVHMPCHTVGPLDRSGPKYFDMEVNISEARYWVETLLAGKRA